MVIRHRGLFILLQTVNGNIGKRPFVLIGNEQIPIICERAI